jgi:hypothetical protein
MSVFQLLLSAAVYVLFFIAPSETVTGAKLMGLIAVLLWVEFLHWCWNAVFKSDGEKQKERIP